MVRVMKCALSAPWAALYGDNQVEIAPEDRSRISLDIQGQNNTVIIKKLSNGAGKIRISLAGDNNTIFLDEGVRIGQYLTIIAGQLHKNFGKIENTDIHIGKNTGFESCSIFTYNSHALLHIGEQCMIAFDVTIYHTDAHPIYDVEKKNIINKVKTLSIGNHCWLGARSTILKNVILPDDCIVGWGSVVSSRSISGGGHCILSGNPARVVKTGVTWSSDGSNGYVQNEMSIQ